MDYASTQLPPEIWKKIFDYRTVSMRKDYDLKLEPLIDSWRLDHMRMAQLLKRDIRMVTYRIKQALDGHEGKDFGQDESGIWWYWSTCGRYPIDDYNGTIYPYYWSKCGRYPVDPFTGGNKFEGFPIYGEPKYTFVLCKLTSCYWRERFTGKF